MKKGKLNLIFLGILCIAIITILIQIIHISLSGHEICLNSGCQFIEGLTNIPSFLFNLIGLIYFLFILIFKLLESKELSKKAFISKTLDITLICGASIEGILFSFQIFVAHNYCSYCLFIFLIIFLLIFLRGIEIFFISTAILLSEIIIFSFLNFSTALLKQINKGLLDGSFAQVITTSNIETQKNNQVKLFLIFSKNCPHCKNVLEKLPTKKITVPFYLNPLSKISYNYISFSRLKLKLFNHYNPNINFIFMKFIKDKEIPLLVIQKTNDIKIIKGDKDILSYIKKSSLLRTREINHNSHSNISKEGCIFGTSCSEENNKGKLF